MSAYKCIKCEIVDKNTLLASLDVLGLKYTEHATPQKLSGFRGDQRENLADIIVSRYDLNKSFTGASNDLGFLWNKETNKYDMIVSDYDIHSGLEKRIKQAYAKTAIENALKNRKFTIKSSTDNSILQSRTRTKVQITAQKVI